jgi:hypothetical protein
MSQAQEKKNPNICHQNEDCMRNLNKFAILFVLAIILIILFAFIASAPTEQNGVIINHIFTSDKEITEYSNGSNVHVWNAIIYGGQQHFFDSNGTTIEKVKSLKNCEFCSSYGNWIVREINSTESEKNNITKFLDVVPTYNVTIIDYNYTSIKLTIYNSSKLTSASVPIDILSSDVIPSSTVSAKSYNLSLTGKNTTFIIAIRPLSYIKLGDHSTVIILNQSTYTDFDVARYESPSAETWANARSAASGTNLRNYTNNDLGARTYWDSTTAGMWRSFLPVNTSSIPADATITNASYVFFVNDKSDTDNDGEDYVVFVGNTSQSSLFSGYLADYSQCGALNSPTEVSGRTDITDITINTQQIMYLNAVGISYINQSGFTKFGIREGHDISGNSLVSGTSNYIYFNSSRAANPWYFNVTYSTYEELHRPAYNISNCSNMSVYNATYYLNNSITDSYNTTQCMDISEANITLNCQGNTIDGHDDTAIGIRVRQGNATIINCTVSDWGTGLSIDYYASGLNNVKVNYSTFTSNDYNVYLYANIKNFTIDRSIISLAQSSGLFFTDGDSYASIYNTRFSSNCQTNSGEDLTFHVNYGLIDNITFDGIGCTNNFATDNYEYTGNVIRNVFVKNRSVSGTALSFGALTYSNFSNIEINSSGNDSSGISLGGYCSDIILDGINIHYDGDAGYNIGYGLVSSAASLTARNINVTRMGAGTAFSGSDLNLTNVVALNSTVRDIYIESSICSTANVSNLNASGKYMIFTKIPINFSNWNNNISGIYLCGANNSNISNFTFSQTAPRNDMISLSNSQNVSIQNITIDKSYNGIYAHNSNNLTINKARLTNTVQEAYYNNNGIHNILKNIDINNATNGIYEGGTGGDYQNITVRMCGGIGINMYAGGYLYNSTIYNNTIGIYVATNGIIYNNTVYNNSIGLELYYATGNNVYNNYFNNTNNTVCVPGTAGYANFLNTSKQNGTRIYSSGNKIGGNYYSNLTGKGYSDTCVDLNRDGFCDTAYTLCAGNIDYLPYSKNYTPAEWYIMIRGTSNYFYDNFSFGEGTDGSARYTLENYYTTPKQVIQNGSYRLNGSTANDEPISVVRGFNYSDYSAFVDAKSSNKTGGAFICPRFNTVNYKYEVELDFQYDQLVFSVVDNGAWNNIAVASLGAGLLANDTWYNFGVIVTTINSTTTNFKIYFNNTLYINLNNSNASMQGKKGIALLAYDWNNMYDIWFDNFNVSGVSNYAANVNAGETIQVNWTVYDRAGPITTGVSGPNISVGNYPCTFSVTAPYCDGTPNACSTWQHYEGNCTYFGCDWYPVYCQGTPTACLWYNETQSNCTYIGCAYTPGDCSGSATACVFFNSSNASCTYAACSYNLICNGTLNSTKYNNRTTCNNCSQTYWNVTNVFAYNSTLQNRLSTGTTYRSMHNFSFAVTPNSTYWIGAAALYWTNSTVSLAQIKTQLNGINQIIYLDNMTVKNSQIMDFNFQRIINTSSNRSISMNISVSSLTANNVSINNSYIFAVRLNNNSRNDNYNFTYRDTERANLVGNFHNNSVNITINAVTEGYYYIFGESVLESDNKTNLICMRLNITGWDGNTTNTTIPSEENGRSACIMDTNIQEEQGKALTAIKWLGQGRTTISLQFKQNISSPPLADYKYLSLFAVRLTGNFNFNNDSDGIKTTASATYSNASSVLTSNNPGIYLYISGGVANGTSGVDYLTHMDLNGTNEGTVNFRPVHDYEYYPITMVEIDTLYTGTYNHTFQFASEDGGTMGIKNTMALAINLNTSEYEGVCSPDNGTVSCRNCSVGECGNCSVGGCTLIGNCSGSPNNCDTYDTNRTNCTTYGCGWTNSSCAGTPQTCEYYNTSESNCSLYGCAWDTNCQDTPNSCGTYTINQTNCTLDSCTWYEAYTQYALLSGTTTFQGNCTLSDTVLTSCQSLFVNSTIASEDGDIVISDTENLAICFVSGGDISFTVAYPKTGCKEGDGCTGAGCSACTYCSFNFTDLNESYRVCTGETELIPFYNFTNTGDVAISFNWSVNTTFDSHLAMFYNTTNGTSGSTLFNDSKSQQIVASVATSTSQTIWIWGNLTRGLIAGSYDYQLNSTSVQA